MSHFSVVVCIDSKNVPSVGGDTRLLYRTISERLEVVLAPYDENSKVTPYRKYEEGGPADYWLYHSLQRADGNARNGTGVLPYRPDAIGWESDYSKETAGEQQMEIARKAALFQSLPEPVTWEALLDVNKILYPGDDDDDQLLIDEEDNGRAYRMSTYNPDSKWDYWRIGGRWGGHFTRKADSDSAAVLLPEKGWDSPDKFAFYSCDGGQKGALDLAAMREDAAARAIETYQEYHALVDALPEAQPWTAFTGRIDTDSGYTIEQARTGYRAQPRVQAVQGTDFQWDDDPVAKFAVNPNLYSERARARAVPGFALVTLDGRWMAPGQMGWFATTDATESTETGYQEAANAYIESLPDDAWLVAVDMHI